MLGEISDKQQGKKAQAPQTYALEHKGWAGWGWEPFSFAKEDIEAPEGKWNRLWPQTCLIPQCIPDSPCVHRFKADSMHWC